MIFSNDMNASLRPDTPNSCGGRRTVTKVGVSRSIDYEWETAVGASRLSTVLCVLALGITGCAVVDSLSSGLRSVGRWAEGFAFGSGEVVDGEQQGDWEFQYEGGQLRARGKYKDDVQDGPWTYWYANGDKEWEGTFVDSLRSGRWTYWHKGETPKAQGVFVDGREFGEWIFWSARGSISQRGAFLNGRRTGLWTYFDDRGSRTAEGHCYDGVEVGLWRFWDADGQRSEEWHDYPDGVEAALDTWENGTARREGFLVNGRQDGLWVIRHRGGELRMLGQFRDGSADGTWAAFRSGGTAFATGEVERGRPVGDWEIRGDDGRSTWSASGSSNPPPMRGEWSRDDLAESVPVEEALGAWIAESMSRVADDSILASTAPVDLEQSASGLELAEAVAKPSVPVSAQPWTSRELKEFSDYVRAYELGELPARLASRYGAARRRVAEKAALATGGDAARMAGFLGNPLPLTYYRNGKGELFDVVPPKGRRTVLVILRGFGGSLCVYCAAQAEAYCLPGTLESFKKLGTDVYVVFPGSENSLEAFIKSYEALVEGECPVDILYEDDYKVSKRLGLEGAKVLPSTFVIDDLGIVRYAYVGETDEDRPAVKDILETIADLAAQE